jgi:hypothetical protein
MPLPRLAGLEVSTQTVPGGITQTTNTKNGEVSTSVFLLMLASMTFGSWLGCPVQCNYDYRAYNMSCNSTNPIKFPLNMVWCPENLPMVDNNIAAIENGSFSPCGDTILTMNLGNAGIMVREDGAFDRFSKTVILDLRNNKVKEIQEGIVTGMINIATIYFQNNLIENARGGKLTHDIKETSKGVLYLNNNKLGERRRKRRRVATLPKCIDTIYLDDNISEVTPDYAVFPLITLSGLCLRGNRIKVIQRRAFVGLTNVTLFQKEGSPLKKLTFITLDDNIIEDIKPFAFKGLPAVSY